jgi:NAD(P)-dependent dehydrogenase (short-subunit alcohol dehydrogenase family)
MGRACARRLGARDVLLLTDVAAGPLEQTAQELRAAGARVETQLCDVSDEAAVRKLADRARSLGPLGGIAHTAGISPTMAAGGASSRWTWSGRRVCSRRSSRSRRSAARSSASLR